jgi:hypothetical protein
MKPVLRWWCVATLLTGLLLGQTAAKPKTTKSSTKTSDVQELRDALEAQQKQIEELRQQMLSRDSALQQAQQQAQQAQQELQALKTQTGDAAQSASSAAAAAGASKESIDAINGKMDDIQTTLTNSALSQQDDQRRVTALENLVGRFRFNGDVRVRAEAFQQDCAACANRYRARIRARFGFDGKLNEDFSSGIYLATGSLGDPTSTNETLTNFFDRKTVGLDRAFITYNPLAYKWLSLTGGKFAYTWQRTSVTFDPDLNPEGFSEKFSFDKNYKFIRNVTFGANQLFFNEVSAGADSYAIGGYASAKLQAWRWTSTVSYSAMKWNDTSAILQASGFATQATSIGTITTGSIPATGEGPGCAKGSAGSTPLPSFPNCAFGPNGLTNAVFTDPSGKPRYLSAYLYSDIILNNTFNTGMSRLPFNLLLEYETNLNGAAHPLDANGTTIRTDLGSQRHAYLIDGSIGQTKNKGDLQVGYAFLRQEQDSVLAAFDESDQRAPTNIVQHRVYALYKLRPNTVAAFTWWHGRTLNPFLENAAKAPGITLLPGQSEPYLNRYQLDLIYTF